MAAARMVRIVFMGRFFAESSKLKDRTDRVGYGSHFIIRDDVDPFLRKPSGCIY
jgi:hypothetical protein